MEPVRRPPRDALGDVPARIAIGDFVLDVASVTRAGRRVEGGRELAGVVGTAWLRFPCAAAPRRPFLTEGPSAVAPLLHPLEVVSRVAYPQTQISLADAERIKPDVAIGETLEIVVDVQNDQLQEIAHLGSGVVGWHALPDRRGDVLVEFKAARLEIDAEAGVGRIVDGSAVYPTLPVQPVSIHVEIDGFEVVIPRLAITPDGATAPATVRLPGGIAAPDTCRRAEIDLGTIEIGPGCEIYVDAPTTAFGPWLLADTGLEIEGTGYVLDLSSTRSPAGRPASWRGMLLASGSATGARLVPRISNTGYLRGAFAFSTAVLNGSGLDATLSLTQPCEFEAINPRGHEVRLDAGRLEVAHSIVAGGELGPGTVELPLVAVCEGTAGTTVASAIVSVAVQPDLDLAGVVDNGGREVSWGELTHRGDEVIAWTGKVQEGYLYLPGGPFASYSPDSGAAFDGPSLSTAVSASLTELEAHRAGGVSFASIRDVFVFSPDRPGGVRNPFRLGSLQGWLRVGHLGVDGELSTFQGLTRQPLGEPRRGGYVGGVPFDADLFVNDKRNLVAQFATSAVYDSNFAGRMRIPAPCDIKNLDFARMQLTSTAHIVGGDVVLPSTGVPLDHWKLQLVPIGTSSQSGVVSVRTGRVVFLAAGIAEPVHFATPFGLTWGEMLASGSFGELYLDCNNYGQRFDGLAFNPHGFLLSDPATGIADPFLGTGGTIHFPFFGTRPVNIRDAVDANMATPFLGRNVTVPRAPLRAGWANTDLALVGTWKDIVSNDLAVIECPALQVDYNTTGQNGFLGTGSSEIGFLHSDGIDVQVEIHSAATDIRFSSATNHDVDLGLFARLGGIGGISGCARIEGPLLARMSFYGILEQSAAAGAILGPKVGYAVDVAISVTPSSLDFYASGDMLMAVGGVEVEVNASVHLLADFATLAAEGEVIGRINCDAVIAGLAAEGQITWHADPAMHYLQGRMRLAVFSWTASGGLEGGFFVGQNVPSMLAWVLRPTDARFGIASTILPATLTGIYGYGHVAFGVNWYVLGGGVEIWVGVGAFSMTPPGVSPPFALVGLPYVAGFFGLYVHGEILGGLVSASAWANLALRGPVPMFFDGTVGLRGCVAWVLCRSVTLNAGLDSTGFYLR